VLGEALGRDHRDPASVDVGLRGHPEHTAEVVDVTVGVDDGDDGSVPAVLPVQRQGRGGGLGADEGVDDDDAGVGLDQRHVRQVQAADLVDALDHLVETLFGAQPALPPQAGVHRGGGVALEERVGVVVPHHAPVGGRHHAGVQAPEETAVGVLEVAGVVEGQRGELGGVGGFDRGTGGVCLHTRQCCPLAAAVMPV
jgi:hypothetical protein